MPSFDAGPGPGPGPDSDPDRQRPQIAGTADPGRPEQVARFPSSVQVRTPENVIGNRARTQTTYNPGGGTAPVRITNNISVSSTSARSSYATLSRVTSFGRTPASNSLWNLR